MTLQFCQPFFLEDSTGLLTGTEFVDFNDRVHYGYRCTLRDTQRVAYMLHDLKLPRRVLTPPLACLDFGADNSLGTVKIGAAEHVPMAHFLSRLNSTTRRFSASDGQEYRWIHHPNSEEEWTCVGPSGYHVASYSLKAAGEPQYTGSSGCMLNVEESHGHILVELVVSLLIVRHIAKYNL